jgi:DNA-binding beta-propeller fold protein YncE
MSAQNKNLNRRWTRIAVLILALITALVFPHLSFAQNKKKKAADPNGGLPKRVNFDISKIVWPNPPAIARIKFVEQFTGEKIDFDVAVKNAKTKPKQGWIDRLAGTKPEAEQNNAVPFQLIRTYGVAFDSKGNIYAADQGAGAIFVFNPETKAVEMIRNGHEAHFALIVGIAIDDNDRIFVSDDKLHHIAIINAKHQQEGNFGSEVLVRPGGIAIDTTNRLLYVVDTGNDVVQVFDADTFKLLRHIGTPSTRHLATEPGLFSLPTNVAVDGEGAVYVTDTLNNRVEIFDADGTFISTFGKSGDGAGYFARPKGIAVDADGHIWVIDAMQQNAQVFNKEGRLLIYFGGFGAYPGQFQDPYGIAIDRKSNRVITSEQYQGRVQMFRYVTDAEADQLKKDREGIQAKNPAATAATANAVAAKDAAAAPPVPATPKP